MTISELMDLSIGDLCEAYVVDCEKWFKAEVVRPPETTAPHFARVGVRVLPFKDSDDDDDDENNGWFFCPWAEHVRAVESEKVRKK